MEEKCKTKANPTNWIQPVHTAELKIFQENELIFLLFFEG